MQIILIILLLVLLVFVVDLYLYFNIWQGRIHIGRFADKQTWAVKIQITAQKWLRKTPTIKLTDNNRFVVWDMLRGNYKRQSIQHWQEAALLLGLEQAFEKTGDHKIKKEINAFITTKIDGSGNWREVPKEIDGVILAYAILNINWIDHQRNKPAYDAIWNLVIGLTGDDGTVQYRRHMKDYRYVDTIGFICPFLVSYGVLFGNSDAVALGCRQISEFNEKAMFADDFIPCHTYNVRTGMPAGLFGWGRGLGWYAIGLIDTWKAMPDSDPQRIELTKSVVSFSKMALRFQNQKGGWNWLITDEHTNADSSATATLAWFLCIASEIPEIKGDCLTAKEKALRYLMKVTQRSGAIDLSQGDTKGIGIHSQEFGLLPFTQGFALRAANF
jgi:unsaturated rhamnogalacturonyl hydrolase